MNYTLNVSPIIGIDNREISYSYRIDHMKFFRILLTISFLIILIVPAQAEITTARIISNCSYGSETAIYIIEDSEYSRLGGVSYFSCNSMKIFGSMSPFLRYPIVLNNEWSSSFYSGGDSTNGGIFTYLNVTIESINDTVTTPAGTFTEVVKTVGNYNPFGFSSNGIRETKNEKWFAKGVGIVKVIVYYNDSSTSIGELQSYSISTVDSEKYFPLSQNNNWTFEWDNSYIDTYEITYNSNAVPGQPETIEICPTCFYKKIREALQVANYGDTIEVQSGIYTLLLCASRLWKRF